MTTHASLSSSNSDPLEQVRVLSRRLQWLTLCGGVLAFATAALWWFGLSDREFEIVLRQAMQMSLEPSVPIRLSLLRRVAGFLITGGALMLLVCALYEAYQMLGAFSRGEVFSLGTAIRLRRMALALTALGPSFPVVRFFLGLLFVGGADQTYFLFLFELSDYFLCLLGGLLLAIAWAMVEAARIAEENRGYI
ncbi:DUF2975 domain-containing protein [Burkholderia pseudomallei]|uniref:DUF2975 domain-containing protein n=1 Tax=Burkholderia pseudomallei TaxID=28450 RepID=UPI0004F804B2|nr:DUF2975 domain-containing protein [Burkholderia pseudomallei]AIO94863.1 hypothetical protein DP50_2205 [Burkholderia pseudomallei 576]KGD28355.1 hypothetical protein DP59_3093 [Burkholderia pseudomallei]VBT32388.1 Protein of uncharacterised function (DUF2975) [Burkholderia pseudomallei]